MVKYKIKYDTPVYTNTRKTHLLKLKTFVHFVAPIRASRLNFIDFYFTDCQGTENDRINISIRYGQKASQYGVPLSLIKEDIPLRLVFEKNPCVEKSLDIYLRPELTEGAHVSVWSSRMGPCIVVDGRVEEEVSLQHEPRISIITPVYQTDINNLKKTVKSVCGQVYKKWEWCIVDDGSKDSQLEKYLLGLKDSRIKLKINKRNKGIAAASNEALKKATGEFVCFLDHDDLLTSDALLRVAKALEEDPQTDLIYSDEDKVNDADLCYNPLYKPDWNYNLFLSLMYTCHLSVYRKSLVDELGGLRSEYDGSQDYDFALRFIEKTQRIKHIPRVLYHWRISKKSTSKNMRNKPIARVNAVRAIDAHLKRIGRRGSVLAGPFPGNYRVRYEMDEFPEITIVIPMRDQVHYLKNLMYTLSTLTAYPRYKIVVVNNNSSKKETKSYLEQLKQDPHVKVVDYKKPFNYSAINNWAVEKHVDSDYVLFLNNDVEVMHPEWLTEMMTYFCQDGVSAVGAKLLYVDHRIQHAGVYIGMGGIAGHGHRNFPDWEPGYFSRPHLAQEISAVTGACMLVRKKDFEKVGGFEEDLPKAFNDVDLCLKLRADNQLIIYTPYAKLFHHESVSRGYDNVKDAGFAKAIKYMDDKWGCLTYEDPYYNPNLTKRLENFSEKQGI